MQLSGMRPGQVTQVRGYADQTPRDKISPDDPGNRRVTVIIQYQPITAADLPGAPVEGAKPESGSKPEAGEAKPSRLPPTPPHR